MSARPGTAHYLSPESQYGLIDAICTEVLYNIVHEATAANYFTVTMDEITDLSHLEQIAVVVHLCNSEFNAVRRLICLTESPTITGQVLADIMLNTLQRNGFVLDKLV